MRDLHDCHALGLIIAWAEKHPNLHLVLAAEKGTEAFRIPRGITLVDGRVPEAVRQSGLPIAGHDAYIAGPPGMIPSVVDALHEAGIASEHIVIDSFGLD